MSLPLFSIIIPTLNRANTLQHTLRTVAAQRFSDCEVIVSDNCSTDDTAAVVGASDCLNLRRIKPGQQLSLSCHWEFAMGHAKGRYVCFLGDDDGITKDGLMTAASLLVEEGYPPALGGINVDYHWLDSPIRFHESLCRIPTENWIRRRSSKQMLALLRAHTRLYVDLPMIYRGFVSREVIESVKRRTGDFFRSCISDVYAAIAVASVIDDYVFTSTPLFIEGVSGHSNGAKTMAAEDKSADAAFFVEDSIPFHKELPYAPVVSFLMAESLLQARDAGLLGVKDMMAPRDLIAHAALYAVGMLPLRYEQTWTALEEYAATHDLTNFAEEMQRKHPPTPPIVSPFSNEVLTMSTRFFYDPVIQIRADQLGCHNVYDCMELADRFTCLRSETRALTLPLVARILELEQQTKRYSVTLDHLQARLSEAEARAGAFSGVPDRQLTTYPAARFSSHAGTLSDAGWIVPAGAGDGHVIYGPYASLAPGRYRVAFHFAPFQIPQASEKICLEVVDTTDRFLTREVFRRAELPSTCFLDFEHVNPRAKLEFRVHVTGRLQETPLVFAGVSVEQLGN